MRRVIVLFAGWLTSAVLHLFGPVKSFKERETVRGIYFEDMTDDELNVFLEAMEFYAKKTIGKDRSIAEEFAQQARAYLDGLASE